MAKVLVEGDLNEVYIKIFQSFFNLDGRDDAFINVVAGHPSLGHMYLEFPSIDNFKAFCEALEITLTRKAIEKRQMDGGRILSKEGGRYKEIGKLSPYYHGITSYRDSNRFSVDVFNVAKGVYDDDTFERILATGIGDSFYLDFNKIPEDKTKQSCKSKFVLSRLLFLKLREMCLAAVKKL